MQTISIPAETLMRDVSRLATLMGGKLIAKAAGLCVATRECLYLIVVES